ncbi:MAG TPA: methyltransferase domain-containing protein [Thermoanaerobaculia bacterium]|nr:methyltransferase domain-containing protein [Thermoanaerobaculia bacterium]
MDPQSLAAQYATSANLSARIELHQRFSTNPYGLQRWVFDRLQLASGMRVLEIACGAGSLWRENLDRLPFDLDLVLSDFSVGMVETTREIVPDAAFVTCALPALPFASGRFDLVIANHMLYHVAERQQGLAEIRRVLRPDGALFAATNGIDHLREIKELMLDLQLDAHDVSASFTLENAEEQLRGVFASVERDEYVDSLRVTDPELLLRYIASVSPRAAEAIDARGDEVRSRIERSIASDGAFQVMKSTGSFIARIS